MEFEPSARHSLQARSSDRDILIFWIECPEWGKKSRSEGEADDREGSWAVTREGCEKTRARGDP